MALITPDIHYKPSNNIFPQHILSKSTANEQFLLKLFFFQAHKDQPHSVTNKRWLSTHHLAQTAKVITQQPCLLASIYYLRPYVLKFTSLH